jgi:hypothetical protein
MEWIQQDGGSTMPAIVCPNRAGRASSEGGQTANSVRGEEKKAGATDSPQWLNDSDRVAFAAGTHLPQQVPTPSSRLMSRSEVAPSLTAARICRSDTALHTQTIIGAIVNANANDCQCPLRYVAGNYILDSLDFGCKIGSSDRGKAYESHNKPLRIPQTVS